MKVTTEKHILVKTFGCGIAPSVNKTLHNNGRLLVVRGNSQYQSNNYWFST